MKKVAFFALALGMFVAACNNAGKSSESDSTAVDSAINSAAPIDTANVAPIDSAANQLDSAANHLDSAAHK